MDKGRFFFSTILAIILNSMVVSAACAGFGFGGDDLGKSGLDFNKGYDVNTVTMVSGRVLSQQRTDEKDLVFVDVKTGTDVITLSLGRKSTWETRQIPLRINDQISAKGSIAQGKDGKTYLMVQTVSNLTTGGQAVVRNQSGGPPWISGGTGGMMPGPGGGMMRGGGGGGMMRH